MVVILGIVFPLVAALHAVTAQADARALGVELRPAVVWLEELSSAAAVLLLLPLVAALERRLPAVSEPVGRTLALWAALSVPFSLAHVALMLAARSALFPLLLGQGYEGFADLAPALLYEFRKDLFVYVVILGMLTMSRQIEEGRRTARAARQEARETGQIPLKVAGSRVVVRAGEVVWAQSGGNYVDVMTASGSLLPRITLTELERLLRGAGVDMVRIHRSRLVNRERIVRVTPTRSGDVEILLEDGTVVGGSRRYRDQLEGSSAADGAP